MKSVFEMCSNLSSMQACKSFAIRSKSLLSNHVITANSIASGSRTPSGKCPRDSETLDMLHQVVVKRDENHFQVTYEIFKTKPKSLADRLIVLCRYKCLTEDPHMLECELDDLADMYHMVGTFKMDQIQLDYSDATSPVSILKKLKSPDTRRLINNILVTAGETGCRKESRK